jgi:hypothetical protein
MTGGILVSDEVDDTTEPLVNGAELPDHPANTTALKIVSFGKVYDAEDSRPLRVGLHQNEIRMLMEGEQMALTHLHAYAMLNGHIYHTRKAVTVDCKCIEV